MSAVSPSLADWLTAIGTILAVAVALLIAGASTIKKWIYRPVLKVEFENGPPFARPPTPITVPAGAPPAFGYFIRLRVTNSGKSIARDVEGKLMRIYGAGTLQERNDFDPTNLHWAGHDQHGGEVPRTVDIHKTAFEFLDLVNTQSGGPGIIIYTTETIPRGIPFALPWGDYVFDVILFGKNTEPVEKFYLLHVRTGWVVGYQNVTLTETTRPERH